MKVITITPYQGNDGSDKWNITLEGDRRPLIMSTQPEFDVGHDIPPDKLEVKHSRRGDFFILREESKSRRTPEETAAIRGQVAIKCLSDIFCAGKLEELENSGDPYIVNLREWINSALVKDPFMTELLKGNDKEGKE